MTAPTGRGGTRRFLVLTVALVVGLVATVSLAPSTSGATVTPPPAATSPGPTTPSPSPSTSTPASGADPVHPPGVLSPPVVPPSGSAYLGAFVDPSGQTPAGAVPSGGASGAGGTAADPGSLTSPFRGLARPLALVAVDQAWRAPVDTAALGRVAATGAIPVITWACGDTDADVMSGADDALITDFARQVRSLGAPVMVRWFPDSDSPDGVTQGCLGAGGASGYVAAFRHVQQLLVAAGASNASTVWSIDTSYGSSSDWASFYPGADSTGWIAADTVGAPAAPFGLTTAFGSWYSTFSAYGKPLLLSNTGAAPGSQAQFLAQVTADLPARYPAVRGLVYVDAARPAVPSQLPLDADGLAAFRAVSHDPYFQPARPASAVTISTGATRVAQGKQVSISGSVTAPDLGGGVSYSSNGTALAGCTDLSVATSVDCAVSTLPVGSDSIVATYTGDDAAAPSRSAPLVVVVTPPPAVGTDPVPTTGTPVPSSGPAAGAGQAPPPQGGPAAPACTGPQPPVVPAAAPPGSRHKPAVPGPCQAYLGAFVDPSGATLGSSGPGSGSPNEPAGLTALDQGLARPLSIVQLDQAWTGSVNATQLEQVYSTGAIPMVTWSCGDADVRVANGTDDAALAAEARAMASTGVPLLLRWFPDPGAVPGDTTKCLGKAGAAGYVQAFRRIVAQFKQAGAVNVGFVWSVDTDGPQSPTAPWHAYYPGGDVVDWIAADGYDVTPGPSTAASVTSRFRAWYAEFAASTKPLMISGSGAVAGPGPAAQATYVPLLGTVLPAAFPAVRAVVYSDGYVQEPPSGSVVDVALNRAGQSALDSLSALPYFQPARSATTTSVTASDTTPPQGKVVVLTATVTGPDLGGSVSFLADGSPIAGCDHVPVMNAGSCETSSLAVGVDAVVADYLGDAAHGPSASAPVTVTVGQAAGIRGRPSIPPVGTAYLGAWVRPLPVGRVTPIDQELDQLPSFNSGLSRPLSVVHVYQDWAAPTPAATLRAVLIRGATPMVDWRCGTTDAAIIAGHDDAMITAFASELAQLKAPVFLRWFYEFNFPNSPDYQSCIAGLGPAGYAAAFRHIHALFTAAGATNVAFVWCLSAAGQDQDWIRYYPGPSYVDWIAVDGYLRNSTTYTQGQFAGRFGPWYSAFASFGKPLMITETAALSGAQAQYLADIKSSLDAGYPMIRGLLYFDAPGKGGTYQYPLDKPGYSAFQALAGDSRFQPPLESSATAVTVSTNAARPSQPVTIQANVVADYGGSVSYYSNGSPVAGCQQLPVSSGPGSGCTTVGLPAGTDALTAVFSGDAEYGTSASAPTGVRLAPLFAADPEPQLLPAQPGVPALDLTAVPLTMPTTGPFGPGGAAAEVLDGTPSSLDLWGDVLGRGGYGGAAVLAGMVLILAGGAYMGVTWITDERLKRRLSRP